MSTNEILKEEIRKLKKQLEQYKGSHYCSFIDICKSTKIANYTQQREFIKYLLDMLDDENDIFSVVRVKDVLQKYKETIGVSDENN